MFDPSPAPVVHRPAERVFADTGIRLSGPFLAFYEHYGPSLCGPPISDLVVEDGLPTQYFRHLALQERAPGRVSLKSLGEAWLAEHPQGEAPLALADATRQPTVDLRHRLARHPELCYPRRPLVDIRYLVIHHSGAPAELGPEAIAAQHVEGNGWPGIGYHYLVDAAGIVYHTLDLGLVGYHAAQFNPVAVGVALSGDLRASLPTNAQLSAAAGLLSELCLDLGLPPSALRGHGELVATDCPGARFLTEWKPRLLTEIERLLRQPAVRSSGEQG